MMLQGSKKTCWNNNKDKIHCKLALQQSLKKLLARLTNQCKKLSSDPDLVPITLKQRT